jgi:hypothetical protein
MLAAFYSQMTNVNSCKTNSVKSIIMTGELERTAEEVVVVYFKVIHGCMWND